MFFLNARVTLNTPDGKFSDLLTIKKDNETIRYKENDENNTVVIYNYLEHILIRENNEITMEYRFKDETGNLFIKEINKQINVNIVVNNIISNEKIIEIDYIMDDNKYNYQIDMEVNDEYNKRRRN